MSPSLTAATNRPWDRLQFGICLALTLATLTYLLWPSSRPRKMESGSSSTTAQDSTRLTTRNQIEIAPDSPLGKKLEIVTITPTTIATPVLSVPGVVIASIRKTPTGAASWQFHSPELLNAYTDWQKAVADIAFTKAQLDSIRQLGESRTAAQGALVGRIEKLVEAGTDTERELANARTELLQAQIQSRKEVHEAETAWRLALRSESALSRLLQQAGAEPDLLRNPQKQLDIVSADVPETFLSRVQVGQECEARFPALSARVFAGTVRALSPVLSKERRSLRALFTLDDPDDQLRPGMFADIGLGTNARQAHLVPAAAVVHVGSTDYVLRRESESLWQIVEVSVGELHDSGVEILTGIASGEQLIGQGAILLKPLIVAGVRQTASTQPERR